VEELIQFELSKEFVERFQRALDERDQKFILQSLEDVNPADISALLYEFNSEESKYVMDLLSVDIQAEIVRDLDSDTRVNFLKIYEPAQIITFINLLNSDDAADILNELPIKIREEVLHGLDTELRTQVIDLLRYEATVAGGLMAKELIKVRNNWDCSSVYR
jgi:magnesium transporter